jgi:Na+/proline symporter
MIIAGLGIGGMLVFFAIVYLIQTILQPENSDNDKGKLLLNIILAVIFLVIVLAIAG